MKETIRKLRSSMAANVIGVIIAAIFLFGGIVTVVFWKSFSASFEDEFAESSYIRTVFPKLPIRITICSRMKECWSL